MPSSSAQHEPTIEYLRCVERQEELDRLRKQVGIRKSLLVFGPEGVGKSRLLRAFVENQAHALYVGQMRSPREFALKLLQVLYDADDGIKAPGNLSALSTSSLKGVIHRALDTHSFLMVLDHLDAPSRVVTGVIRDLHYYGRPPRDFCCTISAHEGYWHTAAAARQSSWRGWN
jgi:AAA+ ATPase superfamily predicted ATPase